MPVYHFNFHSYRNWRPDNKRGYVRRGQGVLPPDPQMAKWYDNHARDEAVVFTRDLQILIIRATHDFCTRRKYRFHGAGNEDGHTHLVLSWRGYSDVKEIARRLKNIISKHLGEVTGIHRQWFSRGSKERPVRGMKHLLYLKTDYFPDHPGVFWWEDQPLP
jgi:hypothetical protein